MKITLLYKYIAHDVRQLAHRYAEMRIDDPEKRLNAQTDEDCLSDEQLLLRYVYTGTAHVRQILRDVLLQHNEDTNDVLKKKESWSFTFKHDVFDCHATAELLHWFIVKWCLWQWLKTYAPNEAADAEKELNDLEHKMREWLDDPMPMKVRQNHQDHCETEVEIIYEPIDNE